MDPKPSPVLLEPECQPDKTDWKRVIPLYLLIAPALMLLLSWFYYPIARSFRMAFYSWDGLLNPTFIGLDNFIEMFLDKYFWISLRNISLMLLFQFTLPLIMPFLTAKLIMTIKSAKTRRLYQTLFMVQYMVPPVAGYLLYRYIYENNGVLNVFLQRVHLGSLIHNWLNEPSLALLAILMIGFPFTGGSSMLIFASGFETIPREIYDTAEMDGVNWWRSIFKVDLPFLVHQIRIVVIMTIGGIISNYVAVLLLTQGGPLFRTLVPGYYLFEKAFGSQRYGFACAVGIVLMLIVIVLTVIVQHFFDSNTTYYES